MLKKVEYTAAMILCTSEVSSHTTLYIYLGTHITVCTYKHITHHIIINNSYQLTAAHVPRKR